MFLPCDRQSFDRWPRGLVFPRSRLPVDSWTAFLPRLAARLRRSVLGPSLLAVLPLFPQVDAPVRHAACSIGIDLDVRTPLRWGASEWRLMMGEVSRIWEPYGVDVCWEGVVGRCTGWQVRFRVSIADSLPHISAAPGANPTLGQIMFTPDGPGTDISLSVDAARSLVLQATLGDRPLADWPAHSEEVLVPRVLGRALAHEIGHYLLGSRAHSRFGLMAASYRANQVTFGSSSRFRLDAGQRSRLFPSCGDSTAEGRVARREADEAHP